MSNEEIMSACKSAISEAIAQLKAAGVRKANIEIELSHFIRKELEAE